MVAKKNVKTSFDIEKDDTLAPLTGQAKVEEAKEPDPTNYQGVFSTLDEAVARERLEELNDLKKKNEQLLSELKEKDALLTEQKATLAVYGDESNWDEVKSFPGAEKDLDPRKKFVFATPGDTLPWQPAIRAIDGFHEYAHKPLLVSAKQLSSTLPIETSNGPIWVQSGDWVIRNDDGTLFPITDADFKRLYEETAKK